MPESGTLIVLGVLVMVKWVDLGDQEKEKSFRRSVSELRENERR